MATIEKILYMTTSIAGCIAINLRLLLAPQQTIPLLLVSSAITPTFSAASTIPQRVPSLYHAMLPIQQQQAVHEHSK